MRKKHDEIDMRYRELVKEFYNQFGEELFLLRMQKNLTLNEAAEQVSAFMAAHPINWEQNEHVRLMCLEHVIQLGQFYGKRVKITFEDL